MIKKTLLIISVLTLSNCGFGKSAPTSVYVIDPKVNIVASSCKAAKTIQIATPTASPGLEGRRIAVVKDSLLNYYTGARWTSPATEMLQTVLIESFEQSKGFASVSSDIDGTITDLILRTEVRDYQVTDANAPTVKLRLVAKLIDADTRKIITSMPVEKEITPVANKTADIVEAFNKATAEAAADIVNASKRKVAGCK